MSITLHIHADRDAAPVESVPYGNAAVARIDALTGRPGLGSYILGTAIPSTRRRHGRESAYVAANRGSEWHTTYGSRGFHVRVERTLPNR